MIRAIVRIINFSGPANGVEMPVDTTYVSIDVEAPALELLLAPQQWERREVVGVEIRTATAIGGAVI
jgi:hypothetical protein